MILDELMSEREHLLQLSAKAKEDVSSAPEGSLRIARATTTPNYYHRKNSSDRNGTYIKVSDQNLARALAQKEYAANVQANLKQRLFYIDSLINDYRTNKISLIPESYNLARRRLIKPYLLNDEEYVQKWLEIPFIPNPSYPENLKFETANGIKVRSKLEQIIAENLSRLGIPYKYDAPIYYDYGKVVYPDFTMLNVHQRKIIYYEHFGKMDEDGYRDDFFRKLRLYNSIGLFIGKNFICTFEDKKHPFDFATHRKMFEELLLK